MRALAAIILTLLLPGSGHLLLRRYLKGAVFALLFAVGADLFLMSRFLLPFMAGTPLPMVGLGVAAAVWIYAVVDVIIRLKSLRASDFQTKKDELLKAAQAAWLRDEMAEAERLLRRILALDERDVEAWVHLGKVLKAAGRKSEARQCFRSALNLDGNSQWRWMLSEELSGAADAEPTQAASS